MRDGRLRSCVEIEIGRAMRWLPTDLSGMAGIFAPCQKMANYFAAELEKGRGISPL